MTVRRDAFRFASSCVTGLVSFGAVAATGWVASVAARDYDREQARALAKTHADQVRAAADRAAWLDEHPAVVVVTHRRPHRIVVQKVFGNPAPTAPGRGGNLTRTAPTKSSSAAAAATGAAAPAPPPPPPPPPPPAPSSGS